MLSNLPPGVTQRMIDDQCAPGLWEQFTERIEEGFTAKETVLIGTFDDLDNSDLKEDYYPVTHLLERFGEWCQRLGSMELDQGTQLEWDLYISPILKWHGVKAEVIAALRRGDYSKLVEREGITSPAPGLWEWWMKEPELYHIRNPAHNNALVAITYTEENARWIADRSPERTTDAQIINPEQMDALATFMAGRLQ